MHLRVHSAVVALVVSLTIVGCVPRNQEVAAPKAQLEGQVAANLKSMTQAEFGVECPDITSDSTAVQCTATAPTGESFPVDLEKKEDGFHIVKLGAVFQDNLTKATELSLKQFGFDAADIKCPALALYETEPACTAQVEGVEMRVVLVLGENIGARVESGLIDVSTIETHVMETTALPGGVTSADCGKKFYVAKPGATFECLAKGPEEEIVVHIRIEDAEGRVTVSLTPFEE